MAYDDTLPDDINWVRFLIDDVTATPFFADAEITAILTEEPSTGQALKYFAAARALEVMLVRWNNKGAGLSEKSISKLRKKFGASASSIQSLREQVGSLRMRGGFLVSPEAKEFQVL